MQFLSRSRTASSAEVTASNIYIAEDLTGPTYNRRLKAMLMELKTKNTYERVWTIIKYVCKNDVNKVHTIKDIFD